MGCGGSKEEIEATPQDEEFTAVKPQTNPDDMSDLKFDISKAEQKAVEAGPERMTFISSVLEARQFHSTDAKVMNSACVRLKAHNKKLKSLIATADAEAVHEAMNGGFLGLGCNHRKLIAVLCSRTKNQLELTKKRYRALYDKDIREEVKGETGGDYGRMMSFAMASETDFVIDMIDKACAGWGTAEMILIELFVMCPQKWLKEGKIAWEGRKDKSLIDYINAELGTSYSGLAKLLMLLLKGDREDDSTEADEDKAKEQMEILRPEITKGMFTSADEDVFIEMIGSNNAQQNIKLAEVYENTYSSSLGKGIKDKMSTKLGWCLSALLMPRSDFVAMRLEKAMSGWGTDKGTLLRLLGGLDNNKMVGVLEAYERKYGKPLASALNQEIGGNFARAALTWICALEDPSGGVEDVTEQDVDDFEGDAEKLSGMTDFLLLEHEMLLRFAASLDVETLAEAVSGFSTDDTLFIRTITSRSKRHLGRISYLYRDEHDKSLSTLVDDNMSGWYAYLAKFLVLQPSQSDALLLDLALEGDLGSNDKAALIEFLCARHPRRVRATKKAWERRNDASLVDRLSDELDGDLRTIALTMLKGKRLVDDDADADEALAKKQAKELNTDMEGTAIEILCSNSHAQNGAIAKAYEEAYDMSLGRAIGQEFNGNVKAALTALLLEPAQWYASRLKAAFKGMGTSDRTVCRIIGAHDKEEVKEIAKAYDEKYGRRLKSDIQQECSGDYRRLAVAWVDLPDQLSQPDKLIELPELPQEEKQPFDDDDDDDDFEEAEEVPDPTSAMYGAKIVLWKQKYETAKEAGKKRRTAYYQRLLTMYPPLPQGHKILVAYCEALVTEYQKGEEGMVAAWMSTVDEKEFEDAGTSKEFFDEWNNTSELCLKEKLITVGELKHSWGVNAKKKTLPDAPEEEKPEKVEAPKFNPAPAAPFNPYAPRMTPQMQMMQQFRPGGFGQQQMIQQTMTTHQTVMQRTVMQPPAGFGQPAMVQKMAATVPFGVYGGMQMTVQTPQGPMRVTVPPGYGPGSTFYFNAPMRSLFA